MFFEYAKDGLRPVAAEKLGKSRVTVGYVTVDELAALCGTLDFDESTVDACRDTSQSFRSGVEVHGNYTFTELRILNRDEDCDDFIALYLRKNLFLVVDIDDRDGSTKAKFDAAVKRYPSDNVCTEKVLYAFLDSLLAGDHAVLESIGDGLSEQEDALLGEDVGKGFNAELLMTKKMLSKRYTYYAQLLDIADAVCENDNGIFEEANLIYIDNAGKKISRLCEETNSLKSTVEHLQDAYSSYLDIKMNQTMKLFTVLTSIFFPLTIIVGWYGMNFQHMPEFAWRYGYLYVIALSVVTVCVLIFLGKRKRWF